MFLYVITNKLNSLSEYKRKELSVCYYLNYVKQHQELFEGTEYKNIYQYACDVLNYSRATTDKYCKIGELYAYKDCNNKICCHLTGFNVSQLLELLTLDKENVTRLVACGFINSKMTTNQIRQLVKEIKSKYKNS
jgi:hypothetical protein